MNAHRLSMTAIGLALAIAAGVAADIFAARPAVVRRSSWCPTPEVRARLSSPADRLRTIRAQARRIRDDGAIYAAGDLAAMHEELDAALLDLIREFDSTEGE